METLSIEKIRQILPHRYPFLLVDRVVSMKSGNKEGSQEGRVVEAIKNVTINEEFFNGHFPEKPIMPGEKGEIKVSYDTKRVGGFSKAITIFSNAKNARKIIKIKGYVNKEISFEKENWIATW